MYVDNGRILCRKAFACPLLGVGGMATSKLDRYQQLGSLCYLPRAVKSHGRKITFAETMSSETKPRLPRGAILDTVRRAARQEQFLEVVAAAEARRRFE